MTGPIDMSAEECLIVRCETCNYPDLFPINKHKIHSQTPKSLPPSHHVPPCIGFVREHDALFVSSVIW
ncbi:hypothetical protein XELAEV_18003348mg [Xenopus laevis]|nr:hypothetical protein XELAEV_18003348mg [Xenopus laevis]